VCDADPARAAAAAKGAATFGDPHALMASDKVEAVVIASPDATHADFALAAIAAGKPVLCEKPIAATRGGRSAHCRGRIEAGSPFVQVGFMRRFDQAYVDMRRARADGSIGTPSVLHNVHRNLAAPAWFTGAWR